ncbi:MAG TPA: protein kinase [Thermoanaerobaculia bacterium]|nr:protein kinase [Thermoanaerobaculia bacterium]
MALAPGSRLGPYEITSRLGAGGMGEVYQAVDTRLDRNVAVKVLSSELAHSGQVQLRFEREAKTISQLNHPNICTLHDVGHESGTSYLVMELLDGETLADRIARGPLSLADVVRYGSQIAEGLDRAHRAGVIHRDLKPSNIMITKSGAKLLDFGMAKTAVIEVNPEGATHHQPLTQEGTILGTIQYMAPEQLEGMEADARTDIFALGAVLYEMVTGKRAFRGKTRTSLMAAIAGSEPSAITSAQPLAPTSLEHVITRCLEKNPEDRWQSAHDIAEELKWSGSVVSERAASLPARWLWLSLAVLAIVAAASSALYLFQRVRKPEAFSFSIMPPHGYSISAPAISPDGRDIAFEAWADGGERSLWVRRAGSVDPVRITEKGSLSRPSLPFWSPDGKWIGFVDLDNLMKVSAGGGRPEVICRGVSDAAGASWSKSGTILFGTTKEDGLFRVAASGGEPVRVTSLDRSRRETLHYWPKFLDDGDHFLFLRHTVSEQKNEIYAGALSKPVKKFLVKADSLLGEANGHLLFVRDGAIYAQPFDQKKLELTGELRKVVDDVFYSEDAVGSYAGVSSRGAMVYLPASNETSTVEIGWYDRNGRLTEKLFEAVNVAALRLSADETKLVMLKLNPRKGAYDVYSRDLARGVETRLTAGLSNHRQPLWSRSGDRVFFSSDRDGMYDLYSVPDEGASTPSLILKSGEYKIPSDLSPDGRFLLVNNGSTNATIDLWLVPLVPGQSPRPLIATEGIDGGGRFSPDGKSILYTSDVSGRFETYVRPFPEGRAVQVSTEGGGRLFSQLSGGERYAAEWTADGSAIVFISPDRSLMSVPIARTPSGLQPGKPTLLFRLPKTMTYWTLSVRSDRILGCSTINPSESIKVINYLSDWSDRQ